MLALTLSEMLSVCLHGWVFDLREHHRCCRKADLRLVILTLWHTISLEVMLVMTSVPIIA